MNLFLAQMISLFSELAIFCIGQLPRCVLYYAKQALFVCHVPVLTMNLNRRHGRGKMMLLQFEEEFRSCQRTLSKHMSLMCTFTDDSSASGAFQGSSFAEVPTGK